MTQKDWTPEGKPVDDADPLSATGMFLNALGKESNQPQTRTEINPPQAAAGRQPLWPAEQGIPPFAQEETPVRTAVEFEPPKSAPGEFTRLFQAATSPAAPPPPKAPVVPPPVVSSPAPPFEPKPAAASAPGEFTRIFVNPDAKPADRVAAPPPTRVIPDAPPATHQASSPPRMKGFSSGASDSASAEGGFTQFFQARPAPTAPAPAPTPAPAPRVQAYAPPTPSPAPPKEEIMPRRQPDFKTPEISSDPGGGSSSVTELFASLAPAKPRQQEVKPERLEPLPSYTPASHAPTFTPAPPPEPSSGEAGSVTRLIQRLSATPAAEPPQASAPVAAPQASSGPGEFTRMINAGAMRSAPSAPAPPPAAPPPAAAAPIPMPAFAPPAMPAPPPMPAAQKPAAPPPPAFQAPKFEPPKPAAPAFAPPALAAPKSKLEEMVPILLVVNTFLLVVLIVVVVFALKAR